MSIRFDYIWNSIMTWTLLAFNGDVFRRFCRQILFNKKWIVWCEGVITGSIDNLIIYCSDRCSKSRFPLQGVYIVVGTHSCFSIRERTTDVIRTIAFTDGFSSPLRYSKRKNNSSYTTKFAKNPMIATRQIGRFCDGFFNTHIGKWFLQINVQAKL